MTGQDRPRLSVLDGVLLIVGIIIGTSVLRVPASIAQQTTGPGQLLGAILLGGALAACGAYCYAQLARLYPEQGGEYSYLHHNLGAAVSFLFVWSRMTVVQTGSIAATAFIFGDYAGQLLGLGPHSGLIYAAGAVIGLTALNVLGLHLGKVAQNVLTGAKIAGLLAIVAAGFLAHPAVAEPVVAATGGTHAAPAFGLAMVFVLYAFGGWNEASYLAGDVRRGSRDLALVLFLSLGVVTVAYVAIHAAYMRALGFEGLRGSEVPAAAVVSQVFGRAGALVIAAVAAVIALGTANATIFTGSRALQAAGANHRSVSWLGYCDRQRATPSLALVLQGIIATVIVLVAGALGEGGRKGFEVAVEYTAPAFWGFMTLIGIAALREFLPSRRGPAHHIGFVLSAIVFVGLDLYMLRSSVAYVGKGALLGLVVVALGVPVYLLVSWLDSRSAAQQPVALPPGQAEEA